MCVHVYMYTYIHTAGTIVKRHSNIFERREEETGD